MFLHDTVSKCVCSGLQKLINYPAAALWCHGVSAFASFVFQSFLFSLFCFVSVVRVSPWCSAFTDISG